MDGNYSPQRTLVAFVALLLLGACRATSPIAGEGVVPQETDWVECGPIFSAGAQGEWDYYLWGGFAASVVKKDEVFYLYYQGSNGYDEDTGTVTWRAVGVATSPDGLNFTKYAHNPVLTWHPYDHFEEGAVSSGAFLDASGGIAMYYGANTWIGRDKVNADGRLATSPDGFTFTDQGIVLDHEDRSVWGAGDELFPVLGFQDNGRWIAYSIPNTILERGQLGVAWGNSVDDLAESSAARSSLNNIAVWGPASFAPVGPDLYALFLNNVEHPRGPVMEVRTTSLALPNQLSAPVETYRFDNVWEATVLLDSDTNRWLMYYRSADHDYYGVKVASADGHPVSCTP
jgi:hypothetical protein